MEADHTQHGIERFSGQAEGRSRAVRHGGLVYTVATAPGPGTDVAEQTRQSLALLDRNLGDAGSSREHLISATVYLTDIAEKAAMDAVWCEWIGGPQNWPQRACVQAQLAPNTLVEITVVAAVSA